jgi:hypothetical protein
LPPPKQDATQKASWHAWLQTAKLPSIGMHQPPASRHIAASHPASGWHIAASHPTQHQHPPQHQHQHQLHQLTRHHQPTADSTEALPTTAPRDTPRSTPGNTPRNTPPVDTHVDTPVDTPPSRGRSLTTTSLATSHATSHAPSWLPRLHTTLDSTWCDRSYQYINKPLFTFPGTSRPSARWAKDWDASHTNPGLDHYAWHEMIPHAVNALTAAVGGGTGGVHRLVKHGHMYCFGVAQGHSMSLLNDVSLTVTLSLTHSPYHPLTLSPHATR